jgi:HNH endonuclease
MDLKEFFENLQDYLAPKLDSYEQTIYLYIFRQSRLLGFEETIVGFKSARLKIALGVGEAGKPMAESTCYKRLRSLEAKGAIKILGTERNGTRIRLFLPNEMVGLIPLPVAQNDLKLEDIDFFESAERRLAILEREKHKCFYCFTKIDSSNYVIEHVVSRPIGENSYKNLVASCRRCNNRKGCESAEDYFRKLYREGFLNSEEFEERIMILEKLKLGELKPII